MLDLVCKGIKGFTSELREKKVVADDHILGILITSITKAIIPFLFITVPVHYSVQISEKLKQSMSVPPFRKVFRDWIIEPSLQNVTLMIT